MPARQLPARQLRCGVQIIPEGDRTAENALECGAIDPAFRWRWACRLHFSTRQMCPKCGEALCQSCLPDHNCRANKLKPSRGQKKTQTRAT
jgi:hypothetical protein